MHSSNFSLARAKALVKRRFPKSYEVVKDQLPRTRRRKAALQQRSTQDVFWEIYSGNLWGSAESKSGLGSELAATQEVRALLPRLLAELGVDVLLDVPCGDFNWMRHVDLPVREYIGGDIVPPLIDSLAREFQTKHRRFIVLDLLRDQLPHADALLCRDLFLHLSFSDIEKVMENFRLSSCKYLITSTYPALRWNNDILTGEVRPLNLLLPPFNWPKPLRMVDDNIDDLLARTLGVWSRDQIPVRHLL